METDFSSERRVATKPTEITQKSPHLLLPWQHLSLQMEKRNLPVYLREGHLWGSVQHRSDPLPVYKQTHGCFTQRWDLKQPK